MGDPDEWWPESDSLPNNSNTRHGLPCEYLYQNLTKKNNNNNENYYLEKESKGAHRGRFGI